MNTTQDRVGIVGGGPCGMMLALLLARQGVEVVVFERKERLSLHPKAMGVSRRTAEIYRQIGLHEEIVKGSLKREGKAIAIWAKSLVGEEFGRNNIAEFQSPFTPCTALHCPQTWTEQVLYEALRKEPRAEMRFGANVREIAQDEKGACITLENGERHTFPWVAAADGAGSGVRDQLGIGTVGPGDLGHMINTMFRANYGKYLQDRQSILYQVLSQEYFEGFVTVNGDDLWLMHHSLQEGEKPEDYPAERLAEIIRRASGLPDEPVEVLSMRPWVLSPKLSNEFRKGRIFLVGDAAARLSPAGGLGLNTGLQGAHNLAWKLAAVVRGEAGESLLESYHEERHQAALGTMRNTNSNTNELYSIIMAGLTGDWDKVREGVRNSRRGGAGLGQDLGVAYARGAFLPDESPAPAVSDPINEYVPNARPGARAPHLWVTHAGGGRVSILDFLGKGFCLLTGAEGEHWAAETKDVAVFQQGRDFQDEGEFLTLYGLKPDGAVLIRPDGYVGARWMTSGMEARKNLSQALKAMSMRL